MIDVLGPARAMDWSTPREQESVTRKKIEKEIYPRCLFSGKYESA